MTRLAVLTGFGSMFVGTADTFSIAHGRSVVAAATDGNIMSIGRNRPANPAAPIAAPRATH